jgi:hypothetical protein
MKREVTRAEDSSTVSPRRGSAFSYCLPTLPASHSLASRVGWWANLATRLPALDQLKDEDHRFLGNIFEKLVDEKLAD